MVKFSVPALRLVYTRLYMHIHTKKLKVCVVLLGKVELMDDVRNDEVGLHSFHPSDGMPMEHFLVG